eukprot:m.31183 g.31183  ORF g.31183 m.31183 type:complete len:2067 (+) comp8290_c0_seq1:104-6304(+)
MSTKPKTGVKVKPKTTTTRRTVEEAPSLRRTTTKRVTKPAGSTTTKTKTATAGTSKTSTTKTTTGVKKTTGTKAKAATTSGVTVKPKSTSTGTTKTKTTTTKTVKPATKTTTKTSPTKTGTKVARTGTVKKKKKVVKEEEEVVEEDEKPVPAPTPENERLAAIEQLLKQQQEIAAENQRKAEEKEEALRQRLREIEEAKAEGDARREEERRKAIEESARLKSQQETEDMKRKLAEAQDALSKLQQSKEDEIAARLKAAEAAEEAAKQATLEAEERAKRVAETEAALERQRKEAEAAQAAQEKAHLEAQRKMEEEAERRRVAEEEEKRRVAEEARIRELERRLEEAAKQSEELEKAKEAARRLEEERDAAREAEIQARLKAEREIQELRDQEAAALRLQEKQKAMEDSANEAKRALEKAQAEEAKLREAAEKQAEQDRLAMEAEEEELREKEAMLDALRAKAEEDEAKLTALRRRSMEDAARDHDEEQKLRVMEMEAEDKMRELERIAMEEEEEELARKEKELEELREQARAHEQELLDLKRQEEEERQRQLEEEEEEMEALRLAEERAAELERLANAVSFSDDEDLAREAEEEAMKVAASRPSSITSISMDESRKPSLNQEEADELNSLMGFAASASVETQDVFAEELKSPTAKIPEAQRAAFLNALSSSDEDSDEDDSGGEGEAGPDELAPQMDTVITEDGRRGLPMGAMFADSDESDEDEAAEEAVVSDGDKDDEEFEEEIDESHVAMLRAMALDAANQFNTQINSEQASAAQAQEPSRESLEQMKIKEEQENIRAEQEAAKREKIFQERERKLRIRKIRQQDIFSPPKDEGTSRKSSINSFMAFDFDKKDDTAVAQYIAARTAECPAAQAILRARKPNYVQLAAITAGMFRLERQLSLLPRVFAKALLECSRRDPAERKAVTDRVKEVRSEYLIKLIEANDRLVEFGQRPHDLAPLEDTLPYQSVALALGLTQVTSAGKRNSLIAHKLNVDAETPEPNEQAEADGNFDVMKQMGLLSSKTTKAEPEDNNPFFMGDMDTPLYDVNEFGSENKRDSVEQDYFDIKDLLKELDDEVLETVVTVSDRITWLAENGQVFHDYKVELVTDLSAFNIPKKIVRRSFDEIEWLCDTISNDLGGGFELPQPLPSHLPNPTGNPELDEIAMFDHLDDLGRFLTSLADNQDANEAKCLQTFLQSDDRVHQGSWPDAYTTNAVDVGEIERVELAEYPLYHLKAIAAHYSIDISKCVRPLEYADQILVHRNASEALPSSERVDVNANVSGEGFKARPSSIIQQENLDPENFRNSVELFEAEANEDQQRKLQKFRDFCNNGGGRERLPITVSKFFEILELSRCLKAFEKHGYDDLRVITALSAEELGDMQVPETDRVVFTQASFEWTIVAGRHKVIQNWAREVHRAKGTGIFVAMSAEELKQIEKMEELDKAAMAEAAATGKPVLSADGTYYVGPDGRMDLKHGDEVVQMGYGDTTEWDPTPILKLLYYSPPPNSEEEEEVVVTGGDSDSPVAIEGYLDKLPRTAGINAVMKRWNRKYFIAKDGELFYYADKKNTERPMGFIRLLGSKISFAGGGTTLKIYDPKSQTEMVVRTSSIAEAEHWKAALDQQAEKTSAKTYKIASKKMHTMTSSTKLQNRNSSTVIFDIGGCSVRAGFAGDKNNVGNAWPELFFPAVLGSKSTDGRESVYIGEDALVPKNRVGANLSWPFLTTEFLDQGYKLNDVEKICSSLYEMMQIDPADYTMALTEPQLMTKKDRERMAEIMFETFNTPALFMKSQPLLAMYSYGVTTGVIVDIGERLDIIALEQGVLLDKGTTRLRYGGRQVTEQMQRMMSEMGHRFFSPVEHYIARLVKERVAYVAPDYGLAEQADAEGAVEVGVVDCRRFSVPDGTRTFRIAGPRFRCAEGLFDPNMWGKDNLGIGALVHKAIMAAPIDSRKALARNIYLSGGGSKITGIAERLQKEVQSLLPASSVATVHADPKREHAAFRGMAVLANLSSFDSSCLDQDDWREIGPSSLDKFDQDTSSGDGGTFSSDEDSENDDPGAYARGSSEDDSDSDSD